MLELNDRAAQAGTPAMRHLYIVGMCVEGNRVYFRVLGFSELKHLK